MSGQLWNGLLSVLMGVGAWVTWWLKMFSDGGHAQMMRSTSKSFYKGRNTNALFVPARASMFLLRGIGILMELTPLGGRLPQMIVMGFVLLAVCLMLVSFLPIRLPRQMYPEWPMEKRRRQVIESAERARATGTPRTMKSRTRRQRNLIALGQRYERRCGCEKPDAWQIRLYRDSEWSSGGSRHDDDLPVRARSAPFSAPFQMPDDRRGPGGDSGHHSLRATEDSGDGSQNYGGSGEGDDERY